MSDLITVSEPIFPGSGLVIDIDRSRPYDPSTPERRSWVYRGDWGPEEFLISGGENRRYTDVRSFRLSDIRAIRPQVPDIFPSVESFLAHLWKEREDIRCLDGPAMNALRSGNFGRGHPLRDYLDSSDKPRVMFATVIDREGDIKYPPRLPGVKALRVSGSGHGTQTCWKGFPIDLSVPYGGEFFALL